MSTKHTSLKRLVMAKLDQDFSGTIRLLAALLVLFVAVGLLVYFAVFTRGPSADLKYLLSAVIGGAVAYLFRPGERRAETSRE